MVRPTQQLHPSREPVPARPAATVLLLRDTPAGIEVLMTRRSAKASFASSAYVFPGGRIDAADHEAHARAARRPTQHDELLTQSIAAIRESFEELGVLLAQHADGRWATDADIATLDRQADFFAQCEARGLTLAADAVFMMAHWITSPDNPKRFDTTFLVARMPEDQQPVADEAEQFEPVWVRPADALERHASGNFAMIFPTVRTLESLRKYPTVQSVLEACSSELPLLRSCPRGALREGKEIRVMEHEPAFGELDLVCPDGQVRHALDWHTDRPVPLLRNLIRLTAPNPGIMTGPGTNTYIVGDAATGYLVVDPGPHDTGHIARIVQATGGDVRMIVCTHSHADHSPGARPLQALCPGRPPILGLPSQPTAGPHSQFTPDRALDDGEVLVLEGGGESHSLRVIHTPGHAANHLCLALLEDGLLFSGDHILNGSTTVIIPPDGDMTEYLDSLDKLTAACESHGLAFILPAHGHVLGNAPLAIAQLKGHRLAREAKVRAAMEARPAGSLDDWLPLAYDDVPQAIWPVARHSLRAHVDRLRALQGQESQ